MVAWLLAATLSVVVENQTIDPLSDPTGTIVIERTAEEGVENFRLGGEPFSPKLIGEEKTNGTIISTYQFQPPFEQEGLNIIPAVTVTVGENELRAPSRSFSVQFEPPEKGLVLKAFVFGDEPFYPGERLRFVYKVFYRGNVSLTEEELPLIHAEGFKKIGDLQVEDTTFEGYQVRVITQRVETQKPGTFSFPQSVMKGIIDRKEEVMTVVEPFSIEVLPFPGEVVPPSFTGALGAWEIRTKLLSESTVAVGEKILLEVRVTGNGNLASISLPSLFCMPGFRGFFTSTGNPIVEKEGRNEKTFFVELIPTTSSIQSIPPVLFTSFLSEEGKYKTIQSNPIALRVEGVKTVPPFPTFSFAPSNIDWEEKEQVVVPELTFEPQSQKGGNWWLWFLPLILPFQVLLKRFLENKWEERKRKWALRKAAEYSLDDPSFFTFLQKALQGVEHHEVFTLYQKAKYGKEDIPKGQILEKAWACISS